MPGFRLYVYVGRKGICHRTRFIAKVASFFLSGDFLALFSHARASKSGQLEESLDLEECSLAKKTIKLLLNHIYP